MNLLDEARCFVPRIRSKLCPSGALTGFKNEAPIPGRCGTPTTKTCPRALRTKGPERGIDNLAGMTYGTTGDDA